MLYFILIVLGIAFYLYTLLGGADFGAGIVELFTGNRSIRPVYKAIAAVWEVNHIWIILAIVIIFNAFPKVYAEVATSLHIPLFIVLIGIIIRGTAFTFRHYDAEQDGSQWYYHLFFRTSSLITPFFLGVTLGAMINGQITTSNEVNFSTRFVAPWFNWFCAAVGIFAVNLFAYIAAIFICGEVETDEEYRYFSKVSKGFSLSTLTAGALVFLAAFLQSVPLFELFFRSAFSILLFVAASLLMPAIWIGLRRKRKQLIRIALAAQVACIMLAWALIQLPNIVLVKSGDHLTIYNTVAENATLFYLCFALVIGSLLIFPGIFYLFRVFKFDGGGKG